MANSTLNDAFKSLAAVTTPAQMTFVTQLGANPPAILEPIDKGAIALLQHYTSNWLTYPPLEVEYLIQTLNEHLSNCLEIRSKAYDLEIKAFVEANDQVLQRNILDI